MTVFNINHRSAMITSHGKNKRTIVQYFLAMEFYAIHGNRK